jgi:hypothetical protein
MWGAQIILLQSMLITGTTIWNKVAKGSIRALAISGSTIYAGG